MKSAMTDKNLIWTAGGQVTIVTTQCNTEYDTWLPSTVLGAFTKLRKTDC